MASAWEEFYAKTPKPSDLEKNEVILKNFIDKYSETDIKVALITVSSRYLIVNT